MVRDEPDRAAALDRDRPELADERHVLVVGQVLAREVQQEGAVELGAQPGPGVRGERAPQVDAAHRRAERRRGRAEVHRAEHSSY